MASSNKLTDWIHRAPHASKVERIEAFIAGHGYDLHRHDTYAIGSTLSGVQSFQYRGEERHSLPGGTMVLHPDEPHDGQAGTADGFRYRMVYVEPALIQQILGGKPLPFVKNGISSDPRLYAATRTLLQGMDGPMDSLEEQDAMFDLAHALNAVSGTTDNHQTFDYQAAEKAREFMHAGLDQAITLDALAEQSGRDRWSLSRDFRLLFGTSPYRYLTMRRLDLVRALLLQGQSLVGAALNAGFTDQSHMTRHFSKTYGLSPSRWLKLQRIGPAIAA
ncbi:AraC family transcriptional regulator [Rhodoferax saidenbachensis]|uniref:AraC-like DNA-binding protein n=1 Tax=Rhodoferax saidenbachensis TaxID=1484693 RepID=A0ABU1ZKP6_9BURK|nr:AraC family transcriptional regulator [Rhodoferax saidenbachensis]MDR7306122.1 AraC-like DNA-binding protein [Rhodoferax saidenbachensis]